MSFAAAVPLAQKNAANSALGEAGEGPGNFGTWAAGPSGEYAIFHHWKHDDAFAQAVKALPGVVWSDTGATPHEVLANCLAQVNAGWAKSFPPLAGQLVAGHYYVFEGEVYRALKSLNRDNYTHFHPDDVPADYEWTPVPGKVHEWRQKPTGGWYLANPFTGEPDRVTRNGVEYRVAQANAGDVNTFPPEVWGWEVV